MQRRTFLKTAAVTTTGFSLGETKLLHPATPAKNKPKIMVWAHANTDFLGEENIVNAEFERIKESGIDVVLLFIHSHPQENQAWYKTSLNGFVVEDRLSRSLKCAKAVGIEIHPIILGMKDIGLSAKDRKTRSYKSGKPDGSTRDGRFCASWQATRIGALRIASDVINNNELSGLHLDYIRYVDTGMGINWPCSCDACQQNYQQCLGKSNISATDLKNPGMLFKYLQNRTANITDAVVQFKKLADQNNLKLSMAARADYFGSALVEGQDWIKWGHEGLFDFICPMNYTTDQKKHYEMLSMQLNLMAGKTDVYSGLGRKWSGGETETKDMIKQADDAFNLGASGISIFHYRGLLDKDFTALKEFGKSI